MNQKELCKSIAATDEECYFLANLCDKQAAAVTKNMLTHSKFLDLHSLTLAAKLTHHTDGVMFWGGAEMCERKLCIFYPEYITCEDIKNDPPISAIRAIKSDSDKLTHRDYLGALMGLGLKRELIGDIFVCEDGADIFILKDVQDYLLQNFEKAGRKRLSLSAVDVADVRTAEGSFEIMSGTLSSLRLDAAVSLACRISRAKAVQLINQGKVSVNHMETLSAHKEVAQGDRIGVRGFGKLELWQIMGKSRKERIFVEIKRYM